MKVKIWDAPTRIFHWLLVIFFFAAFLASENEWLLDNHATAGYIVLFLIVFRVLWGFVGGAHARFSGFLTGWGPVRDYIKETARRRPPRYLGHNPAVGWAIVAMLALILSLTTSGIITYSGEEEKGIFAGFFSFDTAHIAREAHEFLAYLMIFMVAGHVAMALVHDLVFKENIILSMITGVKEDQDTWQESHLAPHALRGSVARVLIWVTVVIACVALYSIIPSGHEGVYRPPLIKMGNGGRAVIPPDDKWVAECAESCHAPFHPTLLPAESWRGVMGGLNDHFGEDASLDEQTADEILAYLLSSSAELSTSEASRKIFRSLDGATPLRVTETPYWKRKHEDISKEVYSRESIKSRVNCSACHPGASVGSFEDSDIKIPK